MPCVNSLHKAPFTEEPEKKKKNTSLFRHCALLVSKILTCEEKKNKTTMSLCTVETGYFYGCFIYERTKV